MTRIPNVKLDVNLNLEPFVKLVCQADKCRYNLMNSMYYSEQQYACNLKHITITQTGRCNYFEPIPEDLDESKA